MRRLWLPILATGLVAVVLPWSSAPAVAEEKKPFSGYSTEASATPLLLEIYEPTIPIPATPQMELSFGYSTIEADSSSARGRSSYLWPGDPVGEGLKTIVEQLGLPPELAGPIAAQGYPVQVNSSYPSGPETEANEPFPGTVMRTTSGEGTVSASTGFSSDCDVAAPEGSGGGGTPEVPGLPEIPGLPAPELPALPELPAGLGDLTSAFPGLDESLATGTGQPAASEEPAADETDDPDEPTAEEAAACQIPPALSALVDLGGYVSTSKSTVADGAVTTTSRAALGDVRLLGGLVTIEGIHATATASSDGKKGAPSGQARLGTITIAGQEFSFGPEGFTAAGQAGRIPALPDDAAKALAELGITLTLPKPERVVDGDQATTTLAALQVEIDTAILAPVLQQLPLAQLLQDVPFPPEAAILKSLIGALPNLAPRVVLILGRAESTVDTVQGIELPTTPPVDPPTDPPTDGETAPPADGGSTAGGGSTGTTPPAGSSTPPSATGGEAPATGELPAAAPAAAGLPPLFSIPGMLLLGGIALASVAGTYLRRLGAAALGGGASCAHGLDSGLPDLRKA